VLIEDPHRLDGVGVIGVDEHCWRHTRHPKIRRFEHRQRKDHSNK
jgi:hypothetical protein